MIGRAYGAAFGAGVAWAGIAVWPTPAEAGGAAGYNGPGMIWAYGWQGKIFGPIMLIMFLGVVVVRGEIGAQEFEERRRILGD